MTGELTKLTINQTIYFIVGSLLKILKNINSVIMKQKAILIRLNTEVRELKAKTIELENQYLFQR